MQTHSRSQSVQGDVCKLTNNDVLCIQALADVPWLTALTLSEEKYNADVLSSREYAKHGREAFWKRFKQVLTGLYRFNRTVQV